jgi:steroid delta-isomerase-like uncharacterized protein
MTRQETEAFFARRQAAYESLDAAALAQDYTDDSVIESPWSGVHSGREAAVKGLQAVFDCFQDLKLRTDSLVIDGDHVAQVITMNGHNVGGYMGLPPTGKPFVASALFLYDLRRGKIVRERRIYDFTGVLVQVGVLKAKPS